jgi:alpha-tubulin suppressor-like RCC1 family protein
VRVSKLDGLGITDIAAGWNHSLAITIDGKLYAWGDNQYGQLGLETQDNQIYEPTQVPGLPPVQAVAAGKRHSLALTKDHRVFTWGANDLGQLGIGNSQQPSRIPVLVGQLPPIGSIVAGEHHSLALALPPDLKIYAWGDNASGQCGAPLTAPCVVVPIPVPSMWPCVKIAAGGSHSLGLTDSGAVIGWGSNLCGELGMNSGVTGWPRENPIPYPVLVLVGKQARQITAGRQHSLALLA